MGLAAEAVVGRPENLYSTTRPPFETIEREEDRSLVATTASTLQGVRVFRVRRVGREPTLGFFLQLFFRGGTQATECFLGSSSEPCWRSSRKGDAR